MPKSKRDKKVSLTKVKKKVGLELKQKIIDDIRQTLDQYENVFVFSMQQMRNAKLKDLRNDWRDSRFFFGKNKIMQIGLGKSKENETLENISKLSKLLVGQCGLLFTNKSEEEVLNWFKYYSRTDFAKSGARASETVSLPAGPLDQFPHSMEPQLRQLGLPTTLKRGVVTLREEYVVCTMDEVLKPEQTRLLKLLGHEMAKFTLKIKGMWSKDGTFKRYHSSKKEGTTVEADVEMKEVEDEDEDSEDEDSENEDE